MKLFVSTLISALAFSITASASQLSCAGKAWVTFVMAPVPMLRPIAVVITTDSMRADRGTVVASIGGEPLMYKGPLHLNGERQHVILSPSANERMKFTLKVIKDDLRLAYKLTGYGADGEFVMAVAPSILNCSDPLSR